MEALGREDSLTSDASEVETTSGSLRPSLSGSRLATLVFPAQMGLFDRTELDRDLALILQEGLPAGTDASIAVPAVERNYVNRARGGTFDPSGPVRVPSVVGDGTRFFGSGVLRSLSVVAEEPGPGQPEPCGG